MKKLMIGSGIASIAILGFGILFKYLYLPGSAVLIAGGILVLSFVFLPLYFTLKIKEEKQFREKVLVGFTSLVCICVSLSILFKVMHWPGANNLGLIGLFLLLLGFLPVYIVTGIRQADNKVNTIVTSVLILAGCGLFLTLTRSPKATAIQRGLISGNLNRSEMILQGELKLVPQLHHSSTIAAQLVQACEKLKGAIVLEETGCPKLIVDNGCKAVPFTEGPLSDFTNANPDFYNDMQALVKLIEDYNQTLKHQSQTTIPVSSMMSIPQHESLSGAVMYFIQVEMLVLQNERMLLASQ